MIKVKDYNISFYLRNDKVDKYGTMPIYIRFRHVENKRDVKFSLGIRIKSKQWNFKERMPYDIDLRCYLEDERQRINREIYHLKDNEREINIEVIRKIVRSKTTYLPVEKNKELNAIMTREEIVNSPEYYIARIQMQVYNMVEREKTLRNLNNLQLAKLLNISVSRVKQILDGNFDGKLSQLIEIAVKLGYTPELKLNHPIFTET